MDFLMKPLQKALKKAIS